MSNVEKKLDKYVGHLAEGALRFRNELTVGTEAPDFELRSLDGDLVRLSDCKAKSNVVLIFGSFTCGSTVTQLRAGNPPLGSLYRRFRRHGFEFYLVYSVEMHPGEYVPRPTTFEQRLSNAGRLKKEEKVPFPIIVDGIDNEVRKLYHALTNPAFIVDRDGIIVYKSSWTWAPDLEQTLTELVAWEKVKVKNEMVRMCYSEKLVGLTRNAKVSAQVHRRAGPEAVKTFKALLRKEGTKG
jgi:peroxiredoxin